GSRVAQRVAGRGSRSGSRVAGRAAGVARMSPLRCATLRSVTKATRVTVLAGGFGGARMAHGFALLGGAVELTVIGNTGDDLVLHGLHISPDLDTVMYTLAGLANDETGWGVKGETWSAAQMLERYGEPTWFRLGDRDLGTHIVRTDRMAAGGRLTDVTSELTRALGIAARILPMTDDPVRTKVGTPEGWLDFQDYFVRQHHAAEVEQLRFEGVEDARPTAQVLDAVASADLVVIAPSNPFVSVAPVLAIGGMLDHLRDSPAPVIAVSPIVGGEALRGPAAQMMRSLGGVPSAAGIATHYAERYPGLLDVLVIDEADADAATEIGSLGIQPEVASIVIPDESSRAALAMRILAIGAHLQTKERAQPGG
ncbi:MAG: 2-phospho-L-lactate transferase, partial [Candidatus Limnocylindrales bacterium]